MGDEAPPPRPPPPKPSLSRTLTFMMFFLTLFVLIDPTLRNGFGSAAGAVFTPTIGFGFAYPVITILVAGSVTTVVSAAVRHFLIDWVRMTRVNKQMAALRKAQMEALRRGNPGKVQKLREAQMKMQKDMVDVQLGSMKPMAFTLLMFIIVFAWLSNFVYIDAALHGRLYFAVPWSPTASLTDTYVFPSWMLLYSLLAIPLSQIVSRLLKYFSFQKRLAAIEAPGGVG